MKDLNVDKIRKLLKTDLDVYVYDEVTSTNDVAKEIDSGVVFALRQTNGRGRMGRSFYSGDGGLYFSICMRLGGGNVRMGDVTLPFSPGRLTIAAGIAVCKVLKNLGYKALIKWVNDVYVNGKKVCGILAEGVGAKAILGIGINLSSEIPDELTYKAASLNCDTDKSEVAAAVINTLRDELTSPDMDFLMSNCLTLGKTVTTIDGSGIAVGIDADGALLVEQGDKIKRFFSGEAEIAVEIKERR